MGNQQQGEFYVALENLRQDLKEHRQETREDIKSLETKTEQWQDEVRCRFDGVETRLTTIETQTKTTKGIKDAAWTRVLAIIAIVSAAAGWFFHQ